MQRRKIRLAYFKNAAKVHSSNKTLRNEETCNTALTCNYKLFSSLLSKSLKSTHIVRTKFYSLIRLYRA